MAVWKIYASFLVLTLACQSISGQTYFIDTYDNKTLVVGKDLALQQTVNRVTVDAYKVCMCRNAFRSGSGLQSWSFNPITSTCYVSSDPWTTSTEAQVGSYYGYQLPKGGPTEKIIKQDDGMYYFYSTDPERNLADATAYCESRPGFHLPIIITLKQFQAVVVVSQSSGMCWLNLALDPSQGLVWANGISFNVTEQNTGEPMREDNTGTNAYHIWSSQFHDYPTYKVQSVICKGNLDGLPWQ